MLYFGYKATLGELTMRIPMKVDYGVRALMELASQYGNGQVQTSDIALKQGIPESYLEQLMAALSREGLIDSRRGPKGGHSLSMPPSEITLSMVMDTLEPNSSPLDCITSPEDCMFSVSCAQQEIWKSVEQSIHNVLSSITLENLTQRQNYLTETGIACLVTTRITPA